MHSPTREALLRTLEAQRAPVSVTALAEATGWHQNTVRGHLTSLWRDGYLTRTRAESAGRGRPSWLWSTTDRQGSPYAALAEVLAETVARLSPAAETDAREAGRAWGRSLGARSLGTEVERSRPLAESRANARERVVGVMRDQGFAPEVRHGADDDAGAGDPVIVLRQCPLIEAASRHTEVVCAVHLGMVSGVIESAGARDAGSQLTPFAAPGECALRLVIETGSAAA